VNVTEKLQSHYDKKQDQYNRAVQMLYDTMLLSETDCDTVLHVLNKELPGELSDIAHRLRRCLILAVDVQRTEDALVKIANPPDQSESRSGIPSGWGERPMGNG